MDCLSPSPQNPPHHASPSSSPSSPGSHDHGAGLGKEPRSLRSSRQKRRKPSIPPLLVDPGHFISNLIRKTPSISRLSAHRQSSQSSKKEKNAAVSDAASMNLEIRNDAWTTKRTTKVFGKPGGLPLIQAWRTDVRAWKEILDVLGRGEGKVMLFADK